MVITDRPIAIFPMLFYIIRIIYRNVDITYSAEILRYELMIQVIDRVSAAVEHASIGQL